MKCYKVARRTNKPGIYTSIIAEEPFAASYEKDHWTDANQGLAGLGYGITAFSTMKQALKFHEEERSYQVVLLECIGQGELSIPKFRCPLWWGTTYWDSVMLKHGAYTLADILNYILVNKSYSLLEGWPVGTRMFRRVKTIRRIPTTTNGKLLPDDLVKMPDFSFPVDFGITDTNRKTILDIKAADWYMINNTLCISRKDLPEGFADATLISVSFGSDDTAYHIEYPYRDWTRAEGFSHVI